MAAGRAELVGDVSGPGPGASRKLVSFLPVFVPMAACFLCEESRCVLQRRKKQPHVTGRDKAAKLKVLLNEAWDEDGAQGVNGSNSDRAAKTRSCPCAVTTGVRRAHLG